MNKDSRDLHPGVNGGGPDVHRVKFVRLKQGSGVRLGMVSELVDDGRDNVFPLSRFFKLPRAEEVCPQDIRRILHGIPTSSSSSSSSYCSCPSKWRAMLYAIVDLPDPASPVNQKTDGLFDEGSSAQL